MPARLTPKAFIQKATAVHGNRYDYSKITFVHSKEKLPIVCKSHGVFYQSPAKHLSGQGCRSCSFQETGSRCRLSLESFVDHAKSIHGSRYNYDRVQYVNNQTKVTIVCPKHGEFLMSPANHTHKTHPQGCPECSGKTNWNQERFIDKAKELHSGRYGYFKVRFVDINTPVVVICPVHGDFSQKPSKHLLRQGCPYCAGTKRLTTEQFVDRAKEIHGNKYDYEKVKYVNNQTKVTIHCLLHGDFQMTPANHTHKNHPQGCPRCSDKRIFNTRDFVSVASEIHDGLYDYSPSNYVDSLTPVEILCPFHGPFRQKPAVHLRGSGCPRCRLPRGEHKVEQLLKQANVTYECQYSFPDCRDKNPLFFDFVVFKNRRKALVEFNGKQHYVSASFGGNSPHLAFQEIQDHDKIKANYCLKNSLPLLVIRYDEYPLIEQKLSKFLSEL